MLLIGFAIFKTVDVFDWWLFGVDFVCFLNSNNCPKKLKIGEID